MTLEPKILERVRMIEKKNGISYAKPDGKLYRILHVFFSLAVIYTFFIDLFYVLGMLLMLNENNKSLINSIVTVSICTALIIAGYVLSFFRLKLASGILSVLPACFLIPLFAGIMEDDFGFFGLKFSFYWRHLIPLLLIIVLEIALTILALRAKLKTEKQYKKVLENLYTMYHTGSAGDLSEEQWQEFLDAYDPSNYQVLYKQKEETP